MENYKRFYKKALQYFAVALYVENKRLSEQLFQEESINKLKSFILNKKMQMTEKEFFFFVGVAALRTIQDATEEGQDAFKICTVEFVDFKQFIGLIENKD